MANISKKTSVVLLLLAIVLAVGITFSAMNSFFTPTDVEVGSMESSSGGEVTLEVKEPLKIEDESTGSISLEVLPSGG